MNTFQLIRGVRDNLSTTRDRMNRKYKYCILHEYPVQKRVTENNTF